MELKLYVVRSKDGKYFKSKGYGGYGNSWRDNINEAKIYTKPGPARAQITFWSTNYPKYGIPDLIELTVTEDNMRVTDEGGRLAKVKERKAKEKLEKLERETREKALQWWGKIQLVRERERLIKRWIDAGNGNSAKIHPDDLSQKQIVELYTFNK